MTELLGAIFIPLKNGWTFLVNVCWWVRHSMRLWSTDVKNTQKPWGAPSSKNSSTLFYLYIQSTHWLLTGKHIVVCNVFQFLIQASFCRKLDTLYLTIIKRCLVRTGSTQGCCAGRGRQTPCHPGWWVYPAAVYRRAEWSLRLCSGHGTPPSPWYARRSGSMTSAPKGRQNILSWHLEWQDRREVPRRTELRF